VLNVDPELHELDQLRLALETLAAQLEVGNEDSLVVKSHLEAARRHLHEALRTLVAAQRRRDAQSLVS
jgi:hypothetical protein